LKKTSFLLKKNRKILFCEKICLSLQKIWVSKLMKSIKKSSLLFCGACFVTLSLVLVSCGDQRSIKRTAHAFLQHYYVDNNFEAAKTVSTRMTHENIDTRAMIFRLNPNSVSNRFSHFKIDSKEVRNTKAVVFYTLDDNVERQLNLSKVNGTWLVDMPENFSTNPVFSISPLRSSGGFASAVSEPIRLSDVPSYDPNQQTEKNTN